MPASSLRRRRAAAYAFGGLSLLGLAFFFGCSAIAEDDVFRTAEVDLSPMAAMVAPDSVMNNAFAYIDQHQGCFVVPVEGEDMMPRYPKGTALIVYPTDFTTLKRGMTVVYAKHGGGRIAHVLTLQTAEGWATRGFNSQTDDPETVTAGNYLGTVTMAFAPSTEGTN